MDEALAFASREYLLFLLILLFSRGMDFLSTWIATPNLVLEANPLARKLGWFWGIPLNLLICVLFAFWPLPSVIIGTTSLLVAARNFQSAWLMRAAGEENYRDWFARRLMETPPALFLFCLFGQTLLVAILGAALIYFGTHHLVPYGIGVGIIAYALAVIVYTLIGLWKGRRAGFGFGRAHPPSDTDY